MSDIDTGDVVIYQGQRIMVACVHDDYLHVCGYPDATIKLMAVKLAEKASPEQRDHALRTLAESSSRSHRAECARRRLGIS